MPNALGIDGEATDMLGKGVVGVALGGMRGDALGAGLGETVVGLPVVGLAVVGTAVGAVVQSGKCAHCAYFSGHAAALESALLVNLLLQSLKLVPSSMASIGDGWTVASMALSPTAPSSALRPAVASAAGGGPSEDVSNERGWSNDEAPKNMYAIVVTAPVSNGNGWLKEVASWSILLILVTPLVFHADKSSSKDRNPVNKPLKSVTACTSHVASGPNALAAALGSASHSISAARNSEGPAANQAWPGGGTATIAPESSTHQQSVAEKVSWLLQRRRARIKQRKERALTALITATK